MSLKEKSKGKWKKILISFSLIITIVVTAAILLVSPLTKYLVEKYDLKYGGREIKMDWAYVNPFTGYIHLHNIKVFEANNDTIFFSAKGISADLSLLQLLRKTYVINSLVLDESKGTIVKKDSIFNFSDLIQKFSNKKESTVPKAPVRFSILNMEIIEGEFFYREPLIPINYSIKKVNFKSTGKYWDRDTINASISFQSGIGSGDVSSEFMINTNTLEYRIGVVLSKVDLNIIEQYLKDLANYGSVSATIDANLKAKGNFNSKRRVNIQGDLALNDFHFGKTDSVDYASFKKLSIGIREIDPEHKKFFFDTVMISHPYFKYERYDYLDNFQQMFGKKGATVKAINADPEKFNLILEIADYVKILFKNFRKSNYKINSLSVKNGDLQFNDYALNEKFSVSLNPLNIHADSIDNSNKRVDIVLESGIKPYGFMGVTLSMSPQNNKDFDLQYQFRKIPVTLFNPYLITYTAFPLDRGTLELFGNWNVRNDIINSNNHLLVIDPRLTEKKQQKNRRWVPMPLIMFFVREKGNVIDYEIPITGDLKKPDFRVADVITDLVKNIFVKPSTAPYRFEVRDTEDEVEQSLALTWGMRQTRLNRTQERFMKKLAKFLKDNPQAHISVHPIQYAEKEKEYILFYEAKKKYFLSLKNAQDKFITEDDSLKIEEMSAKDSSFVKYLNRCTKDVKLFTIQEKCTYLVSTSDVNIKFDQLIRKRKQVFEEYFRANKTETQVKLFTSENTIPFKGFSFFKLNYKGNIPEPLVSAFAKLKKMNADSPRNKYAAFRKDKNYR